MPPFLVFNTIQYSQQYLPCPQLLFCIVCSWPLSRFKLLKKRSVTALSKQLPRRLMLAVRQISVTLKLAFFSFVRDDLLLSCISIRKKAEAFFKRSLSRRSCLTSAYKTWIRCCYGVKARACGVMPLIYCLYCPTQRCMDDKPTCMALAACAIP